MNSNKFIENRPIKSGGRRKRQPGPPKMKPPIPCSHESEMEISEGVSEGDMIDVYTDGGGVL